MTQAKELYISLRDDPDLEIPEGETRESAAWGEMSRRMRQHKSNSKALSMATDSPVDKLFNFTKEDTRIGHLQSVPSLEWLLFGLSKSPFSDLFRKILNGSDDGYEIDGVTYKHGMHPDKNPPEYQYNNFKQKSGSALHKHMNSFTERVINVRSGAGSEQSKIDRITNLARDFWNERDDSKDIQHEIWEGTNFQAGESKISFPLSRHIRDWIRELRNRHQAMGHGEASVNFANKINDLEDAANQGRLTLENLEDLKDHFNQHPSDHAHIKNDWEDNDGNKLWDETLGNEFSTHSGHEPSGMGAGAGAGADAGAGAGTGSGAGGGGAGPGSFTHSEQDHADHNEKIDDLLEQHEEAFHHVWEKEHNPHGDANPSHSFDDWKAAFKAKHQYKNNKAKHTTDAELSRDINKHRSTHEKFKTDKANAERKRHIDDFTDTAKSKGWKFTKRQIEALIDKHGTASAAAEAHQEEVTQQEKNRKEANLMPPHLKSIDEIKKAMFGKHDPQAMRSHTTEERQKNKHGTVSTSLARDLIAHINKYGGLMNSKAKAHVQEALAFLTDPDKTIPSISYGPNENIKADIATAKKDVEDAVEAGLDPTWRGDDTDTQRFYGKKDQKRDAKMRNFHDRHLNVGGWKGTKKNSEEAQKIYAEAFGKEAGDATSFLDFHEDGKVRGRGYIPGKEGERRFSQVENLKDDGSDDHHKTGDTEARSSKVKSHVSSSTGWNLTKKEKGLLDELHEAHDAAEAARKSGDDDAYMENKEKFDSLTSQLEDEGLDRNDFLHDEDERPKTGPPDPEVARQQIADGWMWHEKTRAWVKRKNWEDRTHGGEGVQGMGSLNSYVGSGTHLGVSQAEMGADGTVNVTPDPRNFVHSKQGLHVSDSDTTTAPSTRQEAQSKHLGNVGQVRDGTAQAHKNGKQTLIAATSHDHMTKHGHSDAPAPETLERVGRGAQAAGRAAMGYATGSQSKINRAVGRGAKAAGTKAKKLIGDLFKEDTGTLTEVEKLQLYMILSKADDDLEENDNPFEDHPELEAVAVIPKKDRQYLDRDNEAPPGTAIHRDETGKHFYEKEKDKMVV